MTNLNPDILLITSWDTACGIAEHSALLKDAVETQSTLRMLPLAGNPASQPASPEDVATIYASLGTPILHLNYHAALHSRWTPDWVRQFQAMGAKIVITYHDSGVPNADQCKQLAYVLRPGLDAMVVHEPFDDLPIQKAHYIRMGVAAPRMPTRFGVREPRYEDDLRLDSFQFKAYDAQPVLGTVGFPFPWKNYDLLAEITGQLGWALILLAPRATQDQIDTWRARNPYSHIQTQFSHRDAVLSVLTGCDATAFTYVTHNTGQSGAILQGIAARKPVIALKTCRQFRALYQDPLGRSTIKWAETFEDVAAHLRSVRIQRIDPGMVALAEQESWKTVGQKYLDLYQGLR